MKIKSTAIALALSLVAASAAFAQGAGSSESPDVGALQELFSEGRTIASFEADGELVSDAAVSLPFEQITLANGSVLKFYADRYGAVAVTEEGHSTNQQLLSHHDFDAATPADVYWAVTTGERPVPEVLLENHELTAEKHSLEIGGGRDRGWWLDRGPQGDALKVDHCISGVNTFVCNTNSSSYPSGPGCFSNSYGTLAWYNNSDEVRRYRTGVCSHGTYDAQITFGYAGPPGCVYFRPLFITHFGQFTSNYFLYAWSGPSGAAPRSYDNYVTYVSGAPFDWGVRYKLHTSGSCSI
ncbi:MAG: hypothetical protein AAFX50_03490 [Acidobacteriota bacterium]